MTSRERMLAALNNERPDRLPCQVHGWMSYYLKYYLNGMGWYQANDRFGLDFAIYVSPHYIYDKKDLANWQADRIDLGQDDDGNWRWDETITTPKGPLHHTGARNEITGWEVEYLIKNEHDFNIWNEFFPIPTDIDFTKIQQAKDKVGDCGIIRSHPFSPGQGSPWQSFCTKVGTQEAIMMAIDTPDFVHHALSSILEKTLRVTEMWKGTPADMVEVGGGAGSSTVISPKMFREFCVPYDQKQITALQEAGLKVVYHLCGGLMPMLDLVVENGTDGLETMTPPNMGGDCDLAKASQQVGDKLFFIGGFDQNAGFESGTPEVARKQVFECFEATQDHAGYIVAPSDHFFCGDPANLQAFADACKECEY
ncbi:MAG: uroporphyrinogen decarboxylase family protein [Candidatus Latescibacteria bacterium]|nr:uroporphyrinogen decarboxylase family protein [Candidatus Latescibacterota bacterium]